MFKNKRFKNKKSTATQSSKSEMPFFEMFRTPDQNSQNTIKRLVMALTDPTKLLSKTDSEKITGELMAAINENPGCFLGAEQMDSRYEAHIKVPLWLRVGDALSDYKYPPKQKLKGGLKAAKKLFEARVFGEDGCLSLIRGTEACIIENQGKVRAFLERGAFSDPANYAEVSRFLAQTAQPVSYLLEGMNQFAENWDKIFFDKEAKFGSRKAESLLVLLKDNVEVTFENDAQGHPLWVLAELYKEFSPARNSLNTLQDSIEKLQQQLQANKKQVTLPSSSKKTYVSTMKMTQMRINPSESDLQAKPLVVTRRAKLVKRFKDHIAKNRKRNESTTVIASKAELSVFSDALNKFLIPYTGGLVVRDASDMLFIDPDVSEFDKVKQKASLLKQFKSTMGDILQLLNDYTGKNISGVDKELDVRVISKVFPTVSLLLHDIMNEAGNCYHVMKSIKHQEFRDYIYQAKNRDDVVQALGCQIELFNAFVELMKVFVGDYKIQALLVPNVGEHCVVSSVGRFNSVEGAIATLELINQDYQKMLINDGLQKHFTIGCHARELAETFSGLSANEAFPTSSSDGSSSSDEWLDIEGAIEIDDVPRSMKRTQTIYFKARPGSPVSNKGNIQNLLDHMENNFFQSRQDDSASEDVFGGLGVEVESDDEEEFQRPVDTTGLVKNSIFQVNHADKGRDEFTGPLSKPKKM